MSKKAVQLEDIIITDMLEHRPVRAANMEAERKAFLQISTQMSETPNRVLQTLCDNAIEACKAGSAGISMLRVMEDGEDFCWNVLAGEAAPYVNGTAPRHHSPCGVTLARGAPQLFSHPETYFEWLQAANLPIVEGLVIPLYKKYCVPFGTIWIMSHDANRHFDKEDVRIMTELGGYATTALRLQGVFEDWPDAGNSTSPGP
jgi:GAF domain-containing protein